MHKNAFDLRTGRCLDDEGDGRRARLRGAGGRGRGRRSARRHDHGGDRPGGRRGCRADRPGGGDPYGGRAYARGQAVRWRASAWGSPPAARSRRAALLERRGAEVESAPAMAIDPVPDDAALRPRPGPASTYAGPVRRHHRPGAAPLVRGGRDVGDARRPARRARRRRGDRPGPQERRRAARPRAARALVAAVECFDDVLAYLRGSTLTGAGSWSRSTAGRCRWPPTRCAGGVPRSRRSPCTAALPTTTRPRRCSGWSTWSRTGGSTRSRSPAPRPPDILLDVAPPPAPRGGRRPFRDGVLATCVGPVTAAPFELYGVPVLQPGRARLAAMVRALEVELPSRRGGTGLDVRGHRLLLHGDSVCVDGAEVALSPAPLAVLRALAERPGHVVSRRELLGHLPSGHAGSEHAVEVAVGRLVPPSVPSWCRRSSSAATACRSPEEESAVKPHLVTVAHGTRAAEGPVTIRPGPPGGAADAERRRGRVLRRARRAELLVGDGAGRGPVGRRTCCCPPATTSPPTCRSRAAQPVTRW